VKKLPPRCKWRRKERWVTETGEDLKERSEWYSEMWGVESTWVRLNERRKRMSCRRGSLIAALPPA
jgi:hypothetical protein